MAHEKQKLTVALLQAKKPYNPFSLQLQVWDNNEPGTKTFYYVSFSPTGELQLASTPPSDNNEFEDVVDYRIFTQPIGSELDETLYSHRARQVKVRLDRSADINKLNHNQDFKTQLMAEQCLQCLARQYIASLTVNKTDEKPKGIFYLKKMEISYARDNEKDKKAQGQRYIIKVSGNFFGEKIAGHESGLAKKHTYYFEVVQGIPTSTSITITQGDNYSHQFDEKKAVKFDGIRERQVYGTQESFAKTTDKRHQLNGIVLKNLYYAIQQLLAAENSRKKTQSPKIEREPVREEKAIKKWVEEEAGLQFTHDPELKPKKNLEEDAVFHSTDTPERVFELWMGQVIVPIMNDTTESKNKEQYDFYFNKEKKECRVNMYKPGGFLGEDEEEEPLNEKIAEATLLPIPNENVLFVKVDKTSSVPVKEDAEIESLNSRHKEAATLDKAQLKDALLVLIGLHLSQVRNRHRKLDAFVFDLKPAIPANQRLLRECFNELKKEQKLDVLNMSESELNVISRRVDAADAGCSPFKTAPQHRKNMGGHRELDSENKALLEQILQKNAGGMGDLQTHEQQPIKPSAK